MAWPPSVIDADKNNSTAMVDDHADHHNELAEAINDTGAYIQSDVATSGDVLALVIALGG
jgi:hypothetical protein